MQKVYIASERVKLCDFKRSYLEQFYEYRSDTDLMRYQSFVLHSQRELEDFFIEQETLKLSQAEQWKQLAVVNTDGALIGDCAFKLYSHEPRLAEIGISLAQKYHGYGYASEALRLLITYAFENLNIHKIVAVVDCRNIPSIKLFENLKFSREAVFKKHYWDLKDKAWFDESHYGMLKEDFIR